MLENVILANLIHNEDYTRKVFPYLKEEYFEEYHIKKIFATYSEYVNVYKEPPSIQAIKIKLNHRKDLNEEQYKEACIAIDELKYDKNTSEDWLIDETEKFCQDRDLFNSVRRAILILDGNDKEADRGSIPKILSDSLAISFDSSVGHDFLEDFNERYDYYHREEERLPFDIDLLNRITKGGLPKKSLTVLAATSGAGKSLVKCHMAANSLLIGKQVLYITMELPEEEVARRIDANIMDITLDQLMDLPRPIYETKVNRFKSKTPGKLIIKEYPTGSANSAHFRHLLNELRLKKNFKPDIIFVDYINICASSRIRGAAAANSYTLIKSIAEELRGLAMEFDVPIVTSTQGNRNAYGNSDIEMSDTAESMGIVHTADAMFALITSEELEELGQLMIKQLKNRWGDLSYYRRFVVGIDRSKMKIFNLEAQAQTNIQNETAAPKDDFTPKNKTSKRKTFDDIT